MKDPFEEFTHIAFRVEALPFYADQSNGKSVELDSYARTGVVPCDHNREWALLVQSATLRGGKVCRLRMVSDPMSEYEIFECEAGYDAGRRAGEDVRVTLRAKHEPVVDYWFYDEKIIELLHYDLNGYYLGSTVREATTEERMLAAQHMRIFDAASAPYPLPASITGLVGSSGANCQSVAMTSRAPKSLI